MRLQFPNIIISLYGKFVWLTLVTPFNLQLPYTVSVSGVIRSSLGHLGGNGTVLQDTVEKNDCSQRGGLFV